MSASIKVVIREKDKSGNPIILVVNRQVFNGDYVRGYLFDQPLKQHSGIVTQVLSCMH